MHILQYTQWTQTHHKKTKGPTVISSEQNKAVKKWTAVRREGIAWGQEECHNSKQKRNNNNNHSPWEPCDYPTWIIHKPNILKINIYMGYIERF